MAKLRSNHSSGKGSNSGGMITKVGIFSGLLAALYFVFNLFSGDATSLMGDAEDEELYQPRKEFYLPTSNGQVIHQKYYTLSYSEEHEQAEWVAYKLTRDELKMEWVKRRDEFKSDPRVRTGSAELDDYYRSGYDRGHLVPAADRMFSDEAMLETFYLSNISPQSRNFNQGIWRELEELTRNWAKKYKELYVVTGPVLSVPPKGTIGDNEVSVPQAYFKVLLDISEPEVKSIAFVIPNQVSYDPLFEFAVSIDEVETLTGIDFFAELLDESLEKELESSFNIDLWEFSKKKYELRVNKWNK